MIKATEPRDSALTGCFTLQPTLNPQHVHIDPSELTQPHRERDAKAATPRERETLTQPLRETH